jgi:ankyrin repeat protein
MSHFGSFLGTFLVPIYLLSPVTWGDSSKSPFQKPAPFQEAAFISETQWTFPTLGNGKFSTQGGTFIGLSPANLINLGSSESAASYTVFLIKQTKKTLGHGFDYLLSNDKTNSKMLYFSEKAHPKQKRLCTLRSEKDETENAFKDVITNPCWVVEFKQIPSLKAVEWKITQALANSLDFIHTEFSKKLSPHKIFASLKKDPTGFLIQIMQPALVQDPFLRAYLASVLALEARSYLLDHQFASQLQKAIKIQAAAGLSLLAAMGIWKLHTWFTRPDSEPNTSSGSNESDGSPDRPTTSGASLANLRQEAANSSYLSQMTTLISSLSCATESAPLQQKDAQKNTTLHQAVAPGNEALVEQLVKDLAMGSNAHDPADLASEQSASRGESEIFAILCKGLADELCRPSSHLNGDTERGKADSAATRLIDLFASIHLRPTKTRKLDAIDKMLQFLNASCDSASFNDKSGNSLLYLAVRDGNCDLLKILIQSLVRYCPKEKLKDRLNSGNIKGQTPLYAAAEKGALEMIQILREAQADINQTDHSKDSPLHVAIRNNHNTVVEALIRWGANLEVVNSDSSGFTPLLLAIQMPNRGAAFLLIENNAKVEEPEHLARPNEYNSLASTIKKSESSRLASVDKKTMQECPGLVLLQAIQRGGQEHQKNNQEHSPFILAIKNSEFEIVEKMLHVNHQLGISKVINKQTPLNAAMQLEGPDQKRMIDLLNRLPDRKPSDENRKKPGGLTK